MNRQAAPQQLSLSISLNDDATFDNFYVPDAHNAEVLVSVRQQLIAPGHSFIYLWGSCGSGLSHLLQAGCHQAKALGLHMQYLPLAELLDVPPAELFAGLETLDYVALDDVHVIAGRPDWEQALFVLYNYLRDNGKRLIVAANSGPQELSLTLADLRSRLQWGLTLQLYNLADEHKQQALQARARARGLELSDEVAHYLLQRLPRTMHELFHQLHHLDQASLAEQRKLTIPFVKKILAL